MKPNNLRMFWGEPIVVKPESEKYPAERNNCIQEYSKYNSQQIALFLSRDNVKHFVAVIIHPVRPFTKFTNSIGKYFTW